MYIDDKQNSYTENPRFIGVVLAEALKANDMYKTRLKRWDTVVVTLILYCNSLLAGITGLPKASWVSLFFEDISSDVDVPGKSTDEDGAGKGGRECKVSMLEIEVSAMYQTSEIDADPERLEVQLKDVSDRSGFQNPL
ncbi:hypothetical protein V6N13_075218 [Hibiscus sabdariffa]